MGLARRGARRGVGEDRKSVARLLGRPDQPSRPWCTDYIRHTCIVPPPSDQPSVLQAPVGFNGDYAGAMEKACGKVRALREQVSWTDDAPTEVVLTRRCLDIGRVTYLLRRSGDRIPDDKLREFDSDLRCAIEHSLRGELSEEAWTQTQIGVKQGGLGLRAASRSALIAAVSSMLDARPRVHTMCASMSAAGLAPHGVLEDTFDRRLNSAIQQLQGSAPDSVTAELRQQIATRMLPTSRAEPHDSDGGSPRGLGSPGRRPGYGLVDGMPQMDDEHPEHRRGREPTQHCLHRIFDAVTAEDLANAHAATHRHGHVVRLRELQHPSVDHTWLWCLGKSRAEALPEEKYVVAVRARLGASQIHDAKVCSFCGKDALDSECLHALVCAGPEATKGHTRVKNHLMDLALQADPAAESEPQCLASLQPDARPADVLCSLGGPGQLAAMDVGITTPTPAHGDVDACELYKTRKLQKYQRLFPQLTAQGITYKPLIWSSWGRSHADASTVCRHLAAKAARRRGLADHKDILADTSAKIGTALQARLADMITRCIGDDAGCDVDGT